MISFFVAGVPAPQGSKSAVVRNGRAIMFEQNKRTMPWREQIALQASSIMRAHNYKIIDGAALSIEAVFFMPRPKSHYGKHGLLKSAPRHCSKKPDIDKMARALLDGLSDIVFDDDSRITVLTARKQYAVDKLSAGVHVAIEVIE